MLLGKQDVAEVLLLAAAVLPVLDESTDTRSKSAKEMPDLPRRCLGAPTRRAVLQVFLLAVDRLRGHALCLY